MAAVIKLDEDGRCVIFNSIISLIQGYSDEHMKALAEDAGVHKSTLYNWVYGYTFNPHINTLVKVANSLGYMIVLQKKVTKPKLRLVK